MISFTITDFRLEEEKDVLGYGQGYVASDSLVNALTGNLSNQLPFTVNYQSDAMWFYFFTDKNIHDSGFRIEYSAGK